MARHLLRTRRLNGAGEARQLELARCANDVAFWADRWVWTYDPREPVSSLPLSLFDKQREFLGWLRDLETAQDDGVVEKSRDMGATWLCGVYAAHAWLFRDGFKAGFGSRKLDLVDKLDDPDCIFEKVRFLVNRLPLWMRPARYDLSYCKLINHDRGSSITGEGGDEIGRGGRASIYFVDEAAFLERPEKVDRALSQTTRCRVDVSTPNGMGNPFYRRRHGGQVKVFTFHWSTDPRKGLAWYEREKRRLDPVALAQEVDIDYTASVEGICIPAAWVQSAIDFDEIVNLPREGVLRAGLDIAGEGKNKTVLGFRNGPVVTEIEAWGAMLTSQTAYTALEHLERRGVASLNYDAGGGYAGTLEQVEADRSTKCDLNGINGGEAPTETVWPDGKTSVEKFLNRRAENAWVLRERFRKTHEHRLHLEGREGGVLHPLDQLISFVRAGQWSGELIAQLSVPLVEYTNERRIQLESKQKMRQRGVESPDFFDMMCFLFAAEMPQPWWKQTGAMRAAYGLKEKDHVSSPITAV